MLRDAQVPPGESDDAGPRCYVMHKCLLMLRDDAGP